MPHEDLLTLVSDLQLRNVSPEDIKKKLLEKGYGEENINGALARSNVIFAAVLGGTYWYASKSLSDTNGMLAKILLNASGTPALLNTEPAITPPTRRPITTPYTPPTTSHAAPFAIISTQTPAPKPTSTPTPAPVPPPPAPSVIQQIVQAIIPTPAPTLTFSIAGNPIAYEGDAVLSWTSTDATSCIASQGWSGTKATTGSETFPGLVSNVTYSLTCTGTGGTVTQNAQVVVSLPDPGTGGGGVGGGGGTPDPTPTPGPTPTPTPGVPTIAAGCAVPSGNPGTLWYVDAVNGSDSTGDGSKEKPWKTLQTVLSTQVNTLQYVTPYTTAAVTKAYNPTGTIHPGDTIELMSGNYGDIIVRGVNNDFITIQPASGQTPVLTSINVYGAAKWKFEGLKVQRLRSQYLPLVSMGTQSLYGPTNNVVFDHNSVSSTDDSSSWTVSDWLANASYFGISLDEGSAYNRYSDCASITNNQIFNVYYANNFGFDNSLFAGNTVNNFAADGIDYAGNNIVLSHNLIENARKIDGVHPDGMQGAIGRGDTSNPNYGYTNVVIDGNIVYRKTLSQPFANGLQGIDAFDMNWTNRILIISL
jgi:hypothetical protein